MKKVNTDDGWVAVFISSYGSALIVLLASGDKSSQSKDIRKAISFAGDLLPMGKTKTTRYDVAEAKGDAAFVAKALGYIARAKGMSQVARDAGLSRENLYKALSGERSPGFDTLLKVGETLGLTLHAEAK